MNSDEKGKKKKLNFQCTRPKSSRDSFKDSKYLYEVNAKHGFPNRYCIGCDVMKYLQSRYLYLGGGLPQLAVSCMRCEALAEAVRCFDIPRHSGCEAFRRVRYFILRNLDLQYLVMLI